MENLATSNYIQRGLALKRKQELAKALLQKIEASNPGPNDMVSGKVVPINPIAQALNTFTGGIADSRLRSAEQEQGQLEDEKRNLLVQALSGGKPLTSEALAKSGASPEDLINFSIRQASRIPMAGTGYIPAEFKQVINENFNGFMDPAGNRIPNPQAMTQAQQAYYNPEKRFGLSQAGQAGKESAAIYKDEGMEGPIYRTGEEVAPGLQNVTPQSNQQPTQQNFNRGNMREPGKSTGFRNFSSDQESYDAIRNQLGLYGKRGINSLRKIISTWSPPNENDTEALVNNASKFLGINPDQELDLNNPHVINHLMTAIEKQEGTLKSVLGSGQQPITPQQKNDLKTQQEIDAASGKAIIETDAKQRAADMALINSEPTQQAGNETSLRNRQEYAKELDKYVKGTGGNPLLDNNPVYRLRESIGAEDNISNLQSMAANFVQEQMTLMQQSGLSPARMMDSNAEREAFERSVAGNGNAAAKKAAFDRYNSKVDALIQAHKEEVRRAKARQGIEPQQAPLQQQVGALPPDKAKRLEELKRLYQQ